MTQFKTTMNKVLDTIRLYLSNTDNWMLIMFGIIIGLFGASFYTAVYAGMIGCLALYVTWKHNNQYINKQLLISILLGCIIGGMWYVV